MFCVQSSSSTVRVNSSNATAAASRTQKPGRSVVVKARSDADGSRPESFLEKIFKKKKETSIEQSSNSDNSNTQKKKKRENELISSEQREQIFGKGLMGRITTGIINNVAGKIAEQAKDMRERTEDAYAIASSKCERDGKLKEALGGGDVKLGPITTQMSNSMVVNGKKQDVTRIGFLAQSNRTGQFASISVTSESVTSSQGEKRVQVIATLANGKSFAVDGLGGGGGIVDGGGNDVSPNIDVFQATNTNTGAAVDDLIEGEIIDASFEDSKE